MPRKRNVEGVSSRRATFTTEAEKTLLKKYYEYQANGKFPNEGSHKTVYDGMSDDLKKCQLHFSGAQLQDKIGNLKSLFRRLFNAHGKSGSSPCPNPLWDELKLCFGGSHTVDPGRGRESVDSDNDEEVGGDTGDDQITKTLSMPLDESNESVDQTVALITDTSVENDSSITEDEPSQNKKKKVEIKTSRRRPAITTQFLNTYTENSKKTLEYFQQHLDLEREKMKREDEYLKSSAKREDLICKFLTKDVKQLQEQLMSKEPSHFATASSSLSFLEQSFTSPQNLPSYGLCPGANSTSALITIQQGEKIVRGVNGMIYIKQADGKLRLATVDNI